MLKIKKVNLSLVIALVGALYIFGRAAISLMWSEPMVFANQPIEPEKVFLDDRLLRVCSCESTGSPNNEPRQFDENGDVLLGKVNPRDVGACQINLDIWGTTAEKLGLNVYTLEGNIKMANWILNNDYRGIENWSWSKPCWFR